MLLTRAGRQAVLRGALLTAVELLDRGLELTSGAVDAPPEAVARLLEELLGTLVLTGDVQRVPELGDRLDGVLTAWGAPPARRAAGFLTRARAAATAQQWEEGLTAVRRARELLGTEPDPASRAALDAVAAHLVLNSRRPDRLESARALAEGAVATAEAVGLPEVNCKALNMLGYCLRPQDLAEAENVFERLVATAETHALPVWRIRGLLELGVLDRIRTTGTDRLLAARKAAEETGAVLMTAWADMHLAQAHVLRDEHDSALESARRLRTTAHRLRLPEVQLIGVGVDAIIAASRGDRQKLQAALHTMESALAGRSAGALWGYADTSVWGWAHGICSLLREEPDRAMAEFTEADRAMRALPSTRGVTGFLGPYLLLRTVRGAAALGGAGRFGRGPAHPGPLGPAVRGVVPGCAAGPRGPVRRGRQGGRGSTGRYRRHPPGPPPVSAPGRFRGARRRLGTACRVAASRRAVLPRPGHDTGVGGLPRHAAGSGLSRGPPPRGPRHDSTGAATGGRDRAGVRGAAPARPGARQPGDRRAALPLATHRREAPRESPEPHRSERPGRPDHPGTPVRGRAVTPTVSTGGKHRGPGVARERLPRAVEPVLAAGAPE